MTNTKSVETSPFKKLGQLLGLTYDGGDDNRLFAETIFTNSKDLTKTKYNEMENDVNNFEVKGDGFVVYAWIDDSGFEYWTKLQEEDNYIQITMEVSDPLNIDLRQAEIAIVKATDHFKKWERK